MSHSAREAALRVLISCRTNGAWADAALKAQLARDGLDRADAALCSRIVEMHHGDIRFSSREGVGTCVTVELRGGTAS